MKRITQEDINYAALRYLASAHLKPHYYFAIDLLVARLNFRVPTDSEGVDIGGGLFEISLAEEREGWGVFLPPEKMGGLFSAKAIERLEIYGSMSVDDMAVDPRTFFEYVVDDLLKRKPRISVLFHLLTRRNFRDDLLKYLTSCYSSGFRPSRWVIHTTAYPDVLKFSFLHGKGEASVTFKPVGDWTLLVQGDYDFWVQGATLLWVWERKVPLSKLFLGGFGFGLEVDEESARFALLRFCLALFAEDQYRLVP